MDGDNGDTTTTSTIHSSPHEGVGASTYAASNALASVSNDANITLFVAVVVTGLAFVVSIVYIVVSGREKRKKTISTRTSSITTTVKSETITARSTRTGEFVRQVSLDVGKVTGEALLEQAKQVPLLAPVAFLVGAVASCATTAVNLRADCLEFGRVVSSLEAILVKAENLEGQPDVISEVKESLEEALSLMNKMNDRGLLSTLLANADQEKFEQIKERIEAAIHRLNLSATVDTATITRAKFKQSEQLKAKLDELGGPESVAQDPTKMRKLEEHMEASEKLIAASITEARKEVRAIGDNVTQANKAISEMEKTQQTALLESRMSFSSLSESQQQQNKKLDDVTGTSFLTTVADVHGDTIEHKHRRMQRADCLQAQIILTHPYT